jgi:acetyl esterase/lipase
LGAVPAFTAGNDGAPVDDAGTKAANRDDNSRYTKGDDGKRLKSSLPGVPLPPGASEYASLKVRAEGGVELPMGYIAPRGKGPFPAVLFLHGGLDTSQGGRGSLREGAVPTRFLNKGFLVAHATRRPMRGDDYADVAGACDDTVAAIRAMKSIEAVDSNSLVLFGGSAGGNLAIHAASKIDVAAVVAGEPATLLMSGMYSVAGGSVGPVYKDFIGAYDTEAKRKTREIIKNLSCPVLMLHGGISQLNTLNKEFIIPEFESLDKPVKNIDYLENLYGFYWGTDTAVETLEKVVEDADKFFRKHLRVQPESR